ncbi:MAG: acetyl xylan esterase [Flavobacteriia bacterium]|nr:acetyl xylan esterase [Flavobacteriia bacterium]
MGFKKKIHSILIILALSLLPLGLVWLLNWMVFPRNPYTFYAGNDPRIRKIGRFITPSEEDPKVFAPGAYLEFTFQGAYLEVMLTDEVRFGFQHNYVVYQIDQEQPVRLKLWGKNPTLRITPRQGIHHIRICKATEASIGYIGIRGIRCEQLLSTKQAKKLFEFIGDSITCGNGSDNSQTPFGKGNWYAYHNAFMSYGAQLSRKLQADWMLSSVSGIGMYSSCCNLPYSMPEVYKNQGFATELNPWTFEKQPIPDLVFIVLGQNDKLQNAPLFEQAYLSFLKKLRGLYPYTTFICCNSPMATIEDKQRMNASIQQVVRNFKLTQDTRIHFFAFQGVYRSGYDKHPTVEEHTQMMNELLDFYYHNLC